MYNRNEILAFIEKRKHATIKDICANFDISGSTARRAVSQLEKLEKCGRFHGGAYSLGQPGKSKVLTRQAENSTNKIRIAKAAASILIRPASS